jgi:hypothetical protein
MNKKKLELLKNLKITYDHSQAICDPIDHAYRQHQLLQVMALTLLDPLYEHLKKEKEDGMD